MFKDTVQPRKKVTFQDIIGLIKTEGLPDAVELKKRVQRGEKLCSSAPKK